jgi:hypothetical protein
MIGKNHFDDREEPPLPEEFKNLEKFEEAWILWETKFMHLVKNRNL